jgi:multiple sugar transport system substrate-binding protein
MAQKTRRALLGAATAGVAAACAPPWGAAEPAIGRAISLARPTPVRFGPVRLRLAVATEGLASLDSAIQATITEAAGQLGVAVELETVEQLANGGAASDAVDANALAQRLLVAVQAGVPPDAVLLAGHLVQTARLQAMSVAQDVSAMMRDLVRRFGRPPYVTEQLHVVAGNWFALPYYQRLTGHWLRESPVRTAGIDPGALSSFEALRAGLATLVQATPGLAPWGIDAADTPDVDAWCWSVIHAWGGALADQKGERVTLETPATMEALSWLGETLRGDRWRRIVPPGAAAWTDVQKNAAFVAGQTAYTYTQRPLGFVSGEAGGQPGPLPDARLVPALAGPTRQPLAAGGGAAWILPRGGQTDVAEALLAAMLDLGRQRRLWQAGGFALPGYGTGWDDATLAILPDAANARRFRDAIAGGARASAPGNDGPQTAAAQAIAAGRLAARMLRAVLSGRAPAAVVAEATRESVQLFRDFGLPGA